jgi:UDP-N-acetylglucosamine:LPS N-acetylglucosamine transferase
MQRGGAARLVRDADMNGERLFAAVSELQGESGALDGMAARARGFAHPGSAQRAADILEEVARA